MALSPSLKQFMDAGAQSVAGTVIHKHKVVGRFLGKDFQLTDDGRKALQALESEPVRRGRGKRNDEDDMIGVGTP